MMTEQLKTILYEYANSNGLGFPLTAEQIMNAFSIWLTKTLPENIKPVVQETDGETRATLSGNGTPASPYIYTLYLNKEDLKGERGEQGERGTAGNGIVAIRAGRSWIEGDHTLTDVEVQTDDNVKTFIVQAQNGATGATGARGTDGTNGTNGTDGTNGHVCAFGGIAYDSDGVTPIVYIDKTAFYPSTFHVGDTVWITFDRINNNRQGLIYSIKTETVFNGSFIPFANFNSTPTANFKGKDGNGVVSITTLGYTEGTGEYEGFTETNINLDTNNETMPFKVYAKNGVGVAEVSYVTIDQPNTATQGTLTDAQLNLLLASKSNAIIFDNEIYLLMDNQHESGYLIYTHVGHNSANQFWVKCITVTVSTKGWVLTTKEVGSGGKLYNHILNFELGVGDNQRIHTNIISADSEPYSISSLLKFGTIKVSGKVTVTNTAYIPDKIRISGRPGSPNINVFLDGISSDFIYLDGIIEAGTATTSATVTDTVKEL